MDGLYRGTYVCSQGVTGLTLSVTMKTTTKLRAMFTFYADPHNPGVPTGVFDMRGTYNPQTRKVKLGATESDWVAHPLGYAVVGLNGVLSFDHNTLKGSVTQLDCKAFALKRL